MARLAWDRGDHDVALQALGDELEATPEKTVVLPYLCYALPPEEFATGRIPFYGPMAGPLRLSGTGRVGML